MLETKQSEQAPTDRLLAARGGVSLPAVLTGVVVSIGTFFLLSALVGGILSVSGVDAEDLEGGADAGVGPGIALIAAFFLAYMWGGYTAGRMGRGAGVVNGLLVPFVALVVGAAVGGAVWALGTTAELNLPFSTNRLPLEDGYVIDWTLGLGAGALVAMFVGGIIGGMLGSRWHTKLERRVAAEYIERTTEGPQGESIDVTNDGTSTVTPTYETPADETPAGPTPPHIERHPSMGGQRPPSPPPPPSQGEDHPTRGIPPSR
jgi:hypothetical protein